MTSYRIDLPYRRPPLTANQRLHHLERARRVKQVRGDVCWLARAAKIPAGRFCTVTLVWAPGDRRRRDEDNLWPTLKAAADGIVDAGVVRDDVPSLMCKDAPRIVPPPVPAGFWLMVEVEV